MTPNFSKTTQPSGDDPRVEVGDRWRPGKWTWVGLVLVLLAVSYILAGFYLVPRLIRHEATAWVKTNLNKSLALGKIKFNPLTFTLDVSDLAIPGDAEPVVSIGHLRVGFSILSLLQHAYYFREVRLDRPFVRAVLRPDHSLNLTELEPRTHSSGPSPAVRIGVLSVSQGKIVYVDNSQTPSPEKTLTPVALTLTNFQTNRAEGSAFTLSAKSDRGEGFAWTGDLSIAPVSSHGRIAVTGLQSSTIQQFAGEYLPITLMGGAIGLDLQYDLSYGNTGLRLTMHAPTLSSTNLAADGKTLFHGTVQLDQFRTGISQLELTHAENGVMLLRATVPQATLEGLRIAPSGNVAGQTIKLATATLVDAAVDYQARKLSVGSVALSGVDLPLRREHDGRISMVAMLPKKSAAHRVQAPPPPEPPAWKVNLASFTLDNARLRFEDLAVSPTAHINVTPIHLSAAGVSSDLRVPFSFKFSAKIEPRSAIVAQGTVTPAGDKAAVTFKLSNLELRPLLPYLPPEPDLEIRSGNVNASGRLRVQGSNLEAAQLDADASLNDFSLYETNGNAELFAWQSFALNHVTYRTKHLTVDDARLSRPFGRITFLPNHTFNFQSLSAKNTSQKQVTVQAPAKAPAGVATAAPAPEVQVHVKKLDIADGTMSFADLSLQPNFHASIDALAGAITNISDVPSEVATIDLKGQVIDQYSPVTINGSMNLLGYDRQTNMHMVFRNIDLPVFDPYSDRYAGYAIARGKLTTELTYKIVNRHLQADHHIIIDQLQWGRATGSKQAVPLPIRLATTLLKDKNGVIDLNVPVTGSLDDPSFHIGPIISQIIGNVIKKAVTSPFRLLGSLFAGADKAQYVDFSPGSAELPAGSSDALGALAKTMADRPELQVDIPASPTTQEDALAITDAQIDKQAMGSDTNQGGFATLGTDDQHKDLLNLYASKLGKTPQYPDFSAEALKTASNQSDLSEDGRREILETQWLRTQLRTTFAPSSTELAALGAARAKAIRDALLSDGKVDPTRVFMASDLTATVTDGRSRVELKIK